MTSSNNNDVGEVVLAHNMPLKDKMCYETVNIEGEPLVFGTKRTDTIYIPSFDLLTDLYFNISFTVAAAAGDVFVSKDFALSLLNSVNVKNGNQTLQTLTQGEIFSMNNVNNFPPFGRVEAKNAISGPTFSHYQVVSGNTAHFSFSLRLPVQGVSSTLEKSMYMPSNTKIEIAVNFNKVVPNTGNELGSGFNILGGIGYDDISDSSTSLTIKGCYLSNFEKYKISKEILMRQEVFSRSVSKSIVTGTGMDYRNHRVRFDMKFTDGMDVQRILIHFCKPVIKKDGNAIQATADFMGATFLDASKIDHYKNDGGARHAALSGNTSTGTAVHRVVAAGGTLPPNLYGTITNYIKSLKFTKGDCHVNYSGAQLTAKRWSNLGENEHGPLVYVIDVNGAVARDLNVFNMMIELYHGISVDTSQQALLTVTAVGTITTTAVNNAKNNSG